MKKTVMILGITGQDGAYLTRLPLNKTSPDCRVWLDPPGSPRLAELVASAYEPVRVAGRSLPGGAGRQRVCQPLLGR